MKYSYKAVFLNEFTSNNAGRLKKSRDCVITSPPCPQAAVPGVGGCVGLGETSHTFCSTFICIAFDLLVGV